MICEWMYVSIYVNDYYTLIDILFHGRLNNRMQCATGLT